MALRAQNGCISYVFMRELTANKRLSNLIFQEKYIKWFA